MIEDEEVVYRILAHLNLLAPGDGPRAPSPRRPDPASAYLAVTVPVSPTAHDQQIAALNGLGTRNGRGQVMRVQPADVP